MNIVIVVVHVLCILEFECICASKMDVASKKYFDNL